MGRGGGGGRSSGGGRRSYSTPRRAPTPRNPPPAARPASSSNPPAPASSSSVVGSAVGHAASAVADGWLWGAGSAMAHRAMDFFMGPRVFKIEHTTSAASTTTAQAHQQGPCDIHAQAFQDCINHNGADISRCQFYVDVLNDCRRRGQVAVVEASG